MQCSACGAANPDGARFCADCGANLAPPQTCPSCGAPARPDKRFCNACGAALGAGQPAPAAEETGARKVVTIVFADLIGSTALHERLDAESVRRFMDAYYHAMRGAVESQGGTVTQLLGDGVKAVFGAPRVAEDDAIRAVRAAVAMQRAFRALAHENADRIGATGLRVAVNTGEVIASSDTEIIGDPVNVAARLQEQARDGDVVIGEATRRIVSELVTLAPLGSFALKGRAESVAAYRVMSLERPSGASTTPFVGRDAELRRILSVYDGAVFDERARLAVVLGSPGLGKSRVIGEVARRLENGATVLLAHCDAAGGATFAPIAAALRQLLGRDDSAPSEAGLAEIERLLGADPDRSRIAAGVAALLAGTPAPPEETFFAVRRFLRALAGSQPTVLAIDDLQWAEPLLLDLCEHLIEWTTDAPLFVLVAARPELRDARSSLATPGGVVAELVTLAGLDAGAATRLAANVIGADDLPAAVAARVLATSEGNPLFVGELVRMLVQDGALLREGDRWTASAELAQLEMPPTIQALLAARIERLRPDERTVLERAAVIGRQFSRAAVAALLPRDLADLDRLLEALRRSELIEPDTGWFLGEPALRFHHLLIRDAAYRRLLKNKRAELHERFADWVVGRVGESDEHDELLGWHLEQAHAHLGELGPLDAHGVALGERAAGHLAAAGRRALARDDVPVAASLLGRAIDRLGGDDPARAELALDWCEALLSAGEVGTAATAIDELGRFAAASERLRAWHVCFVGQRAALVDPQALRTTADAVAAAAEQLTAAGDASGEAKAHFVHAMALQALGRGGACEAALDRALAAARRGHDRRRSNAVLAGAPQAALWGPSPVTRASGRCLDVVRVLRITQGSPAVEAVALRCQGVLEALRGRSEAAHRMIATSRRMVEELGITHRLLQADVFAGLIELIEGDPAAAERCLRPAYQGLRELGLGIEAAQAAANLGRALVNQNRATEAEVLSRESEELAGDDLWAAVAWRGVRAAALAQRGEAASAVEFARAAVEIAAATDSLLDHAEARNDLAIALRAAGRSDEAAAEHTRAIELWESKGATLLAERARTVGREEPKADPAFRGSTPVARPARRRVRANAATACAERIGHAMRNRDIDALAALHRHDTQTIDHPNGTSYDREGTLATLRGLMRASNFEYRQEPLATLGESLVLFRLLFSANAATGERIDVGPYEREQLLVTTVDREGLCFRGEVFAAHHLGDAIACLYQSHAELLPPGPERDGAAAVARSVALTSQRAFDPDSSISAYAPGVQVVDHRMLSTHSAQGVAAMLQNLRAWLDLATDLTTQIDDVLALQPDAHLMRRTFSGTDRESGGAFERTFLLLTVFASDGRIARIEHFDADREADALARFDALIAERPTRRVRPNAATAHVARIQAIISARDADALRALYTDDHVTIDHTTAAELTRDESLRWCRGMWRFRDLSYQIEPLATLGDSLALCHQSTSASGIDAKDVHIGPYEAEQFDVVDADPAGRARRVELFAANQLGDGVARLYERYAELLPDGPERERAAAIARSVALTLFDPDIAVTAFAPGVEAVDHRMLSTHSAQGAAAVLQHLRAWRDLATDLTTQIDDILALQPDAHLMRRTFSGTDRGSGGAFERRFLLLTVFARDGRIARFEWFDVDREADALARFDALTAAPPARRVRPNAATANAARADAAVEARDADAWARLFADRVEYLHHPTGTHFDRDGVVYSLRSMLVSENPFRRHEPLATLGDSLALCRVFYSASAFTSRQWDVGAYERSEIDLSEVDAEGRRCWSECFAADQLGDAIARLYERYAEALPTGPERTRAATSARLVAAQLGRFDLDRLTDAVDPAFETVDHRTLGTWSSRGKQAMVEHWRSMLDLVESMKLRVDDIFALTSQAFLVRITHVGTSRDTGGRYERPYLLLWLFGRDGLGLRCEAFEPDRTADALARLDEFSASPAHPARRVQPNAATANAAAEIAAVQAHDTDAFARLVSDRIEVVDQTTGATYGRSWWLEMLRRTLNVEGLVYRGEPLAVLGESLALCRYATSGTGLASRRFDVGAFESELVRLVEVDAEGCRQRDEIFPAHHLGDAAIRLYERYAGRLPEGPERERATAIARSVAVSMGPFDPDRYASTWSPSIETIDHRFLATHSARGVVEGLRGLRAWLELATDFTVRTDDVLGLRPGLLLHKRTLTGIDRTGGGVFERQWILLEVFGSDGRLLRAEHFDADRDADALARFDELSADPAVRRRVSPNAASANSARVSAAITARDADALETLFAQDCEMVDHTTGAEFGHAGLLDFYRRQFRNTRDLVHRYELLATLGESLALSRTFASGSGASGPVFDVGEFDYENVFIIEVDADGRRRRGEMFRADRLGDATVRLYERYAERQPDGAERESAAAIARAVAVLLGPPTPERWPLAPDIEYSDQRAVGVGSLRGAEAVQQGLRAFIELLENLSTRIDDVLGARPDALLVRAVNSGTLKVSGGEFERHLCQLLTFDAQGQITRWEQFDPEHADAALARFDELTAPPEPRRARRRVRTNAALANMRRTHEAIASRDEQALSTLQTDDVEVVDHTTGTTFDREGDLRIRKSFWRAQDLSLVGERLASLGDALGLTRLKASASGLARGPLDLGPYEVEQILLTEVDAQGRRRRQERFAAHQLGDAVVRMYERYAELLPEGSERERAAATARTLAVHSRQLDRERMVESLADDVEFHDHRAVISAGRGRGRESVGRGIRIGADLFEDEFIRIDDVLALEPDALLVQSTMSGTSRASGGAFELEFLRLWTFDAQGLVSRVEWFDANSEAEAFARFDEVTAGADGGIASLSRPTHDVPDHVGREEPKADPALRIPPNVATHALDRWMQRLEARDWEALPALCAPEMVFDDRRRLIRLTGDRETWLASSRYIARSRVSRRLLATAGDRLMLEWHLFTGVEEAPIEAEQLTVFEVDADGRFLAVIGFDPDDRRAASLEMLDRSASWLPKSAYEFMRGVADRDLARCRAALPDDYVYDDHRRTGAGRIEGADAYVASLAALFQETQEVMFETLYPLARSKGTQLSVAHTFGKLADGGDFESVYLNLAFTESGRIAGLEIFEPEDLDRARARFEELRPDPLHIPANAASRARDRNFEAWSASDWDGLRALAADDFCYEDRSKRALVAGGMEQGIASLRFLQSEGAHLTRKLIATAGNRVAVEHDVWTRAPSEGAFDLERITVTEVDGDGRLRAQILFDSDDRRAAFAEMYDRFAAGEAAEVGGQAPIAALYRASANRDWKAFRSLLTEDAVIGDRRTPGVLGSLDRDQWIASLQAFAELAPNYANEAVRILTWNGRGHVHVARQFGTRDGGPFETTFVTLILTDGERIARIERFDIDAVDAALARFAELCAERH